MKIMIIGGKTEQNESWEKIKEACIEIGKILRQKNHTLELCSPFEDSADYWVLKGYCSDSCSRTTVNYHYVKLDSVDRKLQLLENKYLKINKVPIIVSKSEEKSDMQYAWLFCQLEAMECCQCVLAIGGKNTGSANMLLRFAEGKRKLVIPFTIGDGAAMRAYERREFQLKDKLGNEVYYLNSIAHFGCIIDKIDESDMKKSNDIGERKIFISYARRRPCEADYIETLLRRRGVSVFRDESEFGAGKEIPVQIEENIYKSNTFIAVYCAEYACSPWCYDELELALDLREKGQIEIWILCIDDTRIVSKRARNMVFYQVKSREEIEGKIVSLLS